MLRKTLATLLGAAVLVGGVTVADQAHAGETIKLGTLAPKRSPWGKVFSVWAKAVKKKSGGDLKLKWYFNSQQGDEGAMVAKMRSGQLDGAAVTSVGLSKIHKNVLVLQMPGLVTGWGQLDKVRNALMPQFQKGMNSAGFHMLGTGDVGLARTMSKGKAIRSPEDLKSMKVYAWGEDPIANVTSSVIGYTPVLMGVPSLLPALQSGRVNVLTVPALAAVNLQWASQVDHMNEQVAGVAVGGLVVSQKALDGLPGDSRALLLKTGKKAGKMLTKKIRKEDRKAYKKMAKRTTVVKLDASEKARWRSVFKKIRRKLGQGTFPASLVKKAEGLAGR